MKKLGLLLTLGLTTAFANSPYMPEYELNHEMCDGDYTEARKYYVMDDESNYDDKEINYWKYDVELTTTVVTRLFTEQDKKKLFKALEIIETVINTPEFKQRVLNFTWNGQVMYNNNNGLTNEEVYEMIMSGEETLNPGVDREMDFDVELYRSWNPFSGVYGYTNPDTTRIWLNKKFYRKNSYSAIDVASNLTHEWIHKIGFGHDFNSTPDRPYSVPYAIGYILGELAEEMGY